ANLPAMASFAYDGNGNMITNGTRFLEYDDENELIRVTEPNSWKSEFTYDGKMCSRIRREYIWQSGAWRLNAEIHYIYDGKLAIQERDANNLPVMAYTRGKDLSGRPEWAGGVGGLLALSQISAIVPQHALYHADANGDVTMLVNSFQRYTAAYAYTPFGDPLSINGPLGGLNLNRFASKEHHPGSGTYYFGYRFHDPAFQRWLNRDPHGEA